MNDHTVQIWLVLADGHYRNCVIDVSDCVCIYLCVFVCKRAALHLWEFPSACLSLQPTPPVLHVLPNQSEWQALCFLPPWHWRSASGPGVHPSLTQGSRFLGIENDMKSLLAVICDFRGSQNFWELFAGFNGNVSSIDNLNEISIRKIIVWYGENECGSVQCLDLNFSAHTLCSCQLGKKIYASILTEDIIQ